MKYPSPAYVSSSRQLMLQVTRHAIMVVDGRSGISFVPQMSRSQVQIRQSTAPHAHSARAFFLRICVSVASKGRPNLIPKLRVAGSSPVARSTSTANLCSGPSADPKFQI